MSDAKAALDVPTTTFKRPKSPRATSDQSIRSSPSTDAMGVRAVTPSHDKSLSNDGLQVPPPTPGVPSGQHTPSEQAYASFSPWNFDILQAELTMSRAEPGMTTLYAGQSNKAFTVHTDLLCQRSPYFRRLLSSSTHKHVPATTLTYPDLDEFAFALFVRWLYGAMLTGPSDFHTMQHYICLYVLASTFEIERLKNSVMDLVRYYYRSSNMTAPPYRLEYVYERTKGPNKMRAFLVSTATYRMLCEGAVSEAMKGVVGRGGDLVADLCECLVKMNGDGLVDARRGGDCAWHEHNETAACKKPAKEAYEAD